jgi:hypothetical protein
VVVIAIVVVVAIVSAHVAALACVFELVTPAFCLAAALSMFLDGPLEALFGFLHVTAAMFVTVVVIGVGRQGAGGEQGSCQDRGHSKISECHLYLLRSTQGAIVPTI